MREGLELWLGFVLNIALPALIIQTDERYRQRVSGSLRLQASGPSSNVNLLNMVRLWNTASFWSAVFGFGPLALLVYFGRSRRSWLGWLLGAFWMLAVVTAIGLLASLLPAWA
jgi:hypothetical protein